MEESNQQILERPELATLEPRRVGNPWPLVLLMALATLSPLAACSTATDVDEADEVAIYSAVIRRIYTHDDTFGGTLNAPTVYVVSTTDDGAGDPDIERSEPRSISPAVQEGVVEALADLPADFFWVEDAADVLLEADTGAVNDDGVIVTLGNIHEEEDGSALVSGSIYIASLAAGGQTYIVEKIDDAWQITGTTGIQWMS
jgi:hypothetical protein